MVFCAKWKLTSIFGTFKFFDFEVLENYMFSLFSYVFQILKRTLKLYDTNFISEISQNVHFPTLSQFFREIGKSSSKMEAFDKD